MSINFPPAFDPKLKFTKENPEDRKRSWLGVFKGFWEKKTARMVIYLFLVLVIIYFWIFRYDDLSGGCHIKISPSIVEWNNLKIKRALNFLQDKSPNDYADTCKNVEVISPDIPCGGSGGGCFHFSAPKTIEVSTLGHRDNPAYTAAVIIHETCHVIQREKNGSLDEKECYDKMNKFLDDLGVITIFPRY